MVAVSCGNRACEYGRQDEQSAAANDRGGASYAVGVAVLSWMIPTESRWAGCEGNRSARAWPASSVSGWCDNPTKVWRRRHVRSSDWCRIMHQENSLPDPPDNDDTGQGGYSRRLSVPPDRRSSMLPSSGLDSPLPSSRNTCAVVMKRRPTSPPGAVGRGRNTPADPLTHPQALIREGTQQPNVNPDQDATRHRSDTTTNDDPAGETLASRDANRLISWPT